MARHFTVRAPKDSGGKAEAQLQLQAQVPRPPELRLRRAPPALDEPPDGVPVVQQAKRARGEAAALQRVARMDHRDIGVCERQLGAVRGGKARHARPVVVAQEVLHPVDEVLRTRAHGFVRQRLPVGRVRVYLHDLCTPGRPCPPLAGCLIDRTTA